MLRDALETLGDRTAAVARELTKLYETVRRGTLQELMSEFEAASRPKGEIVVLIGAAIASDKRNEATDELDGRLRLHLTHLSVKDAVAVAVEETGLPRRQVYARAVALAKGDVD
jgi:16S rRNA (cytidine1402-2'-O)-methyltransferase